MKEEAGRREIEGEGVRMECVEESEAGNIVPLGEEGSELVIITANMVRLQTPSTREKKGWAWLEWLTPVL